MQYENPLIVQSDRTLLLDIHAPEAEACRTALIPFAELERSPEHLHTYRLTPLSLWNAASAGFTADDAISVLLRFSRYDVPQSVLFWITETSGRFGKLRLIPAPEGTEGKADFLYLITSSEAVYREISASPPLKKYLVPCRYPFPDTGYADNDKSAETETFSPNRPIMGQTETCPEPEQNHTAAKTPEVDSIQGNPLPMVTPEETDRCFRLQLTDRGTIKQQLLQTGWPVKDEVPLVSGAPLDMALKTRTGSGLPFTIRNYQQTAAAALVGDKGPGTGYGTIVLPCGAGKTIVGMLIMDALQTSTLIITTNISAVHQWIAELLDKTTLLPEQIAEYSGESKEIKPVTVATYQILTWRPDKTSPYPHFQLFREHPWGLIIYDEVHMLPAPVFRVAAEIQAIRRVGLTATLVREDGCEGHVFSLVGPKRYDVPWKELEHSGWIASAECIEVRTDLSPEEEIAYATAPLRMKHRIAGENPVKKQLVSELVRRFPHDKILIIGQYLNQLKEIADLLQQPLITGKTPAVERDKLYRDFRENHIRILIVSKVANFAIDLPDASVAIQVSGTFGSRQEEAQRLGRILRPKERTSRFISLITRNTVEEDFSSNRQKFLAEQGYAYRIIRYTVPEDFDELTDTYLCTQKGDRI